MNTAMPTEPPDETSPDHDLSSMRNRQARGEVAADLDPAAVLLAVMGMVVAPVAMPDMARKIFGVDPRTSEFEERYGGQLRRIIGRLAAETNGDDDE